MTKTRVALFAGQDVGYVMTDYFSGRSDIDLFVVSFQTRRDVANGYRSALALCRERGIPHVETARPYEDASAALRAWQADIFVCAYYARLLPRELLAMPRLGAINVHPGKFPRYLGPMPTPWYILNGETTFGVGLVAIDEGVDTGPVFVQKEYPISDDETGHGLYRKTMAAAAELYIEYFDQIVRGEITAKPQQGEALSCPRIEPQFRIDWSLGAEMIRRHVRVHAKPYFPAYTFLYNRMIAINRARVADAPVSHAAAPGEIVEVQNSSKFVVACGHGRLIVDEYEALPDFGKDEQHLYLEIGARLT